MIWQKWSPTTRFMLLMSLTVIGLILLLTTLNMQQAISSYRTEVENQAALMLSGHSLAASEMYRTDDYSRLDLLTENLRRNAQVQAVRFYDETGVVTEETSSPALRALGPKIIATDSIVYVWQADSLLAGCPLRDHGQIVGGISLELATTELKEQITAVRQQGFLLAFITIAIGIGVTGFANWQLGQELDRRQAAEQALRESRRMLQRVLDTVPVRVFWKDRNHIYQGCNQRFADDIAVPHPRELMGKGDEALPWRNRAAYFHEIDGRLMETDTTSHTVNQYKLPNGKHAWLDTYMAPLHDDTGQVIGILGTYLDITEQRQAEETLRKTQQRYQALFSHTTNAVFLFDFNFVFLDVNQQAADLLGYARDELVNAPVDRIIAPSDTDDSQNQRQSLLDGRPMPAYERWLIRKDGQVVPVEINVSLVYDEHGDPSHIQSIAHDISRRKQAEQTLRDSERRFRALIENGYDTVALVNKDGIITYTSPVTTRLLGYAVEEYVGHAIGALVHPTDKEPGSTVDKLRQPSQIESAAYTVRVRHKDGSWRWVEAIATNMFAEPSVGAMVINFRDVTGRQEAEEALRQTQKLESLGIMSGGIAHDFNNLLTAMLAQSSLLQTKIAATDPTRKHVDRIVKAAGRAANLTQQLLAYSGRGQFDIQPINLNQVIEDNLHLFEVAIPKNVRVELQLAQPLPLVDGDPGQIQQVVMNLIINAAEAMNGRNGRIHIQTSYETIAPAQRVALSYTDGLLPTHPYVALTIGDDGIGMDSQTLAKIFDPFFTTKSTGRGLGLAAALGIVRSHKGGLQVSSMLGSGTAFQLYFPASVSLAANGRSTAITSTTMVKQGTVLVIDDEEGVRESAEDILESVGWRVLTAVDGHSGIELYQTHHPTINLVLLDLSMPGLSGRETLSKLQKINDSVCVILSSGYSEAEAAQNLGKLGVKGFLQKPYSLEQLVAIMSSI
ncbi:MAG: PAS domain S-box protein [Chloroflexota bacterium]